MSKAWENKNKKFETRFKPISEWTKYYVKVDKKGNPSLSDDWKIIWITIK